MLDFLGLRPTALPEKQAYNVGRYTDMEGHVRDRLTEHYRPHNERLAQAWPPLHPEVIMPKPNLFIIGAAKSGTTSLHHALNQHPDLFMSGLKEPAFFVPELKYNPKDPDWYLELFAGGETARYRGESTTHYTKRPLFPGVPQRVHAFAPDARLIYLMRDPIERAISHYWHNTRSIRKEFKETRPMLRALREDDLYRAYGDYAMQLRPWVEYFGREALLTLVYEELVADPGAVLSEVFDWLEVAPFGDASLDRQNARPAGRVEARGFGLLEWLRHSALWERLAPAVPRKLKAFARRRATRIAPPPFEDESEAAREMLRPWAQESVAATSRFLDRSFPLWGSSSASEGAASTL